MAKTLQFRRDTTVNLASVTGAEGELFVDLTKDTLVVMDGSTAGGFPLQRELTAGSGISIVGQTISATGGGASNSFTTIAVAGQSNVVADSTTDTLTLAAGSGISITTNAGTDTVTIAATGGGGGGSGVTENADYSKEITIADTYAYVPTSGTYSSNGNFGYISLNVDSNTGGLYYDGTEYSTANYDTADRSILITGVSGQLLSDISSLTGKYIQWSIMATAYMSKVTNVVDLTGGTYRIFLAANPGGLPQSNGPITGSIATGTRGRVLVNSVIGADLLNVLTKLKSGATISNSTLFSVTTTGRFTNISGTTYGVQVDELFKPEPYSVAPLTIVGNIDAEATWSFGLDGTFTSDSVLAGNVLISDDIITPLAYNSYGLVDSTATGTLTVNGNLDVLGTVTNQNKWITLKAHTQQSRSGAIAAGKVLDINKKYILNFGTDFVINNYSVVLPPTTGFTGGEEVTIMLGATNGGGNSIYVYAYENYPNIEIFYSTLYNDWFISSNSSGNDVWASFGSNAYGVSLTFVYAPWPGGSIPYRWIVTN